MLGWIGALVIGVIVALGVLGAWRGLRREALVTMAGIVPGALLGYFWNEDWGRDLPDGQRGLILLASLFFVTLVLGYGSAVLLRRHRPAGWERVAGAAVGLLNGVLLAAFSLRHVQAYFYGGAAESPLRASLPAAILMDYLPWLFAALVVLFFIAVVAVGLTRLFRFIRGLVQEVGPEVSVSPARESEPVPPSGGVPVAEVPAERNEGTVSCPNCGRAIPSGAAYCPQCGKIIV